MRPLWTAAVTLAISAVALAQQGTVMGGCPIFPANNIWNAPIDSMPVSSRSADYINSITRTGGIRYDAVIPINVVPGTQPQVPIHISYPPESDPGPYPFPPGAQVEPGDRHVIVIDKDNCVLYETYNSTLQPDGSWNVDSGARWSLLSNALRPAYWTSADAAGLPIMPGLVRYDEIVAGQITHAIRFTTPHTQRLFVWPARHYASRDTSPLLPPMGQRFRLKASFDISQFSPDMQVILRALKKYGIILADNGLPWEMQLASDPRWNGDELDTLRSVTGANFEAVDVSSLMVDPDSGQAGSRCSVTFSTPLLADSAAQTIPVEVKADPGCTWNYTSNASWITATTTGPTAGNGTIRVTLAANTTDAARTGTLTIAGNPLTITQKPTTRVFADVPPSDDFFDAINLMGQFGITRGCLAQPYSYCPEVNATRGQMAVFIVRAVMGDDSFRYNASPLFADVPATHPFFQWIQKLRELGITVGCTTTNYCPDDPITRGQMAVFIVRARLGSATVFQYPATPLFTDVPTGHAFFPWIQKMKQIGITSGCSPTQYCPDSPVTRGQMAVFIMRGGFNRLLPENTPLLTTVTPSLAAAGQIVTVTIAGQNTNFRSGTTRVGAGEGIASGNTTVLNATTLVTQLTVANDAAPGPRSITAITDSEEATIPNSFRVQ